MHELAETERLLEVVLQHARTAQARQVTALHLVIGHESAISADALQFYWDLISRGTLAEGAGLHFRVAPVEMFCLACHHPFTSDQPKSVCPACGSVQVKPVAGEAFYLEAIDIEPTADQGL